MSQSTDLRELLDSWPYDPDDDARLVQLAGGRWVVQVRLPMGLEQYELDGRPDGLKPHGCESLLDHHLERLKQVRAAGKEELFELNPTDCEELFQEGTLYYYRYLQLFQLKEWALTERDTARNLRVFDFVHRYASQEDDQEYLERWRPYLLRMNAIARAMIELNEQRYAAAQSIIREAVCDIEHLPELDDETFCFENQRSLTALKELATQLEQTRPLTELERLEKELEQAISTQEFERAATLRDRLRTLRARE